MASYAARGLRLHYERVGDGRTDHHQGSGR
jgi:hypothetical protein